MKVAVNEIIDKLRPFCWSGASTAVMSDLAVKELKNSDYEPSGLVVGSDYHIQPSDCNFHFPDACGRFGTLELELTTAVIVKFGIQKGGWKTFTRQEVLENFLTTADGQRGIPFAFDQLRISGLIYAEDGVHFQVTTDFIEKAMRK